MLGFSPLSTAPLSSIPVVAGPVTIDFSSATTDGSDVLAAVVSPLVAASSATTDGADVLNGQVSAIVAISSATTDGADVLSSLVSPLIGITSNTTDGADVLISTVSPLVAVSSITTDGADVLAASVQIVTSSIDFSANILEGADEQYCIIDTYVTDWWPLVGGAIDRKRYEEEAPEVLPIIEAIAKELPKAPIKELRVELKKRDIAFEDSYKVMLKAIIKAKIREDQERDDEEAMLMLL